MSVDVAQRPPAQYGLSALLRAIPTMRRSAIAAVAGIIVNCMVQAVLMYINAPSGFSAAFLASLAVSVVATLALYAVLVAAALQAVDGTAAPGSILGRVKRHAGPFALWVLVQWLLVIAVAVVHPFLIALVAMLTPFLPLAALDGHGNAMAANFRVIGSRLGRWLVLSLAMMVIAALLFLVTAATTLFVKGTPASFIEWLVLGLVAWWLLTAWALVYRQTPVGRRG